MKTSYITYTNDGELYTFYNDKGEVIAKVKNWFGITELIKLLTIKK